jgi:hypothetical protein
MIRYGGLYARHRESDKKLHHAISKEKHLFFLDYLEWRKCIFISFSYNPLKCPDCGTTMLFWSCIIIISEFLLKNCISGLLHAKPPSQLPLSVVH